MDLNQADIAKRASDYLYELRQYCTPAAHTYKECESVDMIEHESVADFVNAICEVSLENGDIEQFLAINRALIKYTEQQSSTSDLEDVPLDELYEWCTKWIETAVDSDDTELLKICTGYSNYLLIQINPCEWMKSCHWGVNVEGPPEITRLLMSSVYPNVQEWVQLALACPADVWNTTKQHAPNKQALVVGMLKHEPTEAQHQWNGMSKEERLNVVHALPVSHCSLLVQHIPYGLSMLAWLNKETNVSELKRIATLEDKSVLSSIQKHKRQKTKTLSNAQADIVLQIDPSYFEYLLFMDPLQLTKIQIENAPVLPWS